MVLAGLILAGVGLIITAVVAWVHFEKIDQGFEKASVDRENYYRKISRVTLEISQILMGKERGN